MTEHYNILLTGACGGIGSKIAEHFAASGHDLLLSDLNSGPLEKLAGRLIAAHKTRVDVIAADLTSGENRNRVVREARVFRVNVLINAAGYNRFGMLENISDEDVERIFSINIISPILLTKALLPWLTSCESAHIVNIGSTFGSLGYAGFSCYSASKFSLRGFSEALRREIADTGVKVHYLAPRAVKTAFNEDAVNRMNEALGVAMDSPDVIPGAITRMLERGQSEHFIGSPEKYFVKLNALFQRLVDRGLAGQLSTIKQHARMATGHDNPADGQDTRPSVITKEISQ